MLTTNSTRNFNSNYYHYTKLPKRSYQNQTNTSTNSNNKNNSTFHIVSIVHSTRKHKQKQIASSSSSINQSHPFKQRHHSHSQGKFKQKHFYFNNNHLKQLELSACSSSTLNSFRNNRKLTSSKSKPNVNVSYGTFTNKLIVKGLTYEEIIKEQDAWIRKLEKELEKRKKSKGDMKGTKTKRRNKCKSVYGYNEGFISVKNGSCRNVLNKNCNYYINSNSNTHSNVTSNPNTGNSTKRVLNTTSSTIAINSNHDYNTTTCSSSIINNGNINITLNPRLRTFSANSHRHITESHNNPSCIISTSMPIPPPSLKDTFTTILHRARRLLTFYSSISN
jgi:hypothetical protein